MLYFYYQDAFNGPLKVLGRLLFNHIKRKRDGETRAYIHLDEFLEVATDVMSIITDTQQMKYYFDMFAEGKDQLSLEGTELWDKQSFIKFKSNWERYSLGLGRSTNIVKGIHDVAIKFNTIHAADFLHATKTRVQQS